MLTHRLITLVALGSLTVALAQCGGGSPTSPSASPAPSSSPSPTPTPSPSPAPGGSSLSVTPQTIQGQGQPQATVTLASAATGGGALVVLSSSNTSVAKVPATVTVPAGSRSTSFLVDTSTVTIATTVTLTASYGGSSMAATLTVIPPALVASFVVRSPTKGTGACVADSDTQELDCVLDGSASQGFISAYLWTYTMGSTTLRHTALAPDAVSRPQGTGCSFYQQGTGGDGPNGDKFLNMTVTLQVRDANGMLSGIVQQAVRVYPNKQCGFNY
jgi:hypothetical protein